MTAPFDIFAYKTAEQVDTIEFGPGEGELIGRPPRSLIVASDTMMRRAISRSLSRRGIDVAEAPNDDLAEAVMEQWLPDFVVIDISDQSICDILFAASMRADRRWKEIPVIALVSPPGEDLMRTLRTRADIVLPKPFGPGDLYVAVETMVVLPPRDAVYAPEVPTAEVA